MRSRRDDFDARKFEVRVMDPEDNVSWGFMKSCTWDEEVTSWGTSANCWLILKGLGRLVEGQGGTRGLGHQRDFFTDFVRKLAQILLRYDDYSSSIVAVKLFDWYHCILEDELLEQAGYLGIGTSGCWSHVVAGNRRRSQVHLAGVGAFWEAMQPGHLTAHVWDCSCSKSLLHLR